MATLREKRLALQKTLTTKRVSELASTQTSDKPTTENASESIHNDVVYFASPRPKLSSTSSDAVASPVDSRWNDSDTADSIKKQATSDSDEEEEEGGSEESVDSDAEVVVHSDEEDQKAPEPEPPIVAEVPIPEELLEAVKAAKDSQSHVLRLRSRRLTQIPHGLLVADQWKTLDFSNNFLGASRKEDGTTSASDVCALANSICHWTAPSTIHCLRNLSTLDLAYNHLRSCDFPPEFAALANTPLSTLILHHNRLTSPLPAVFAALTQLRVLDLRHNQLTVLPTFPTLKGLWFIRLEDNAISCLSHDASSSSASVTQDATTGGGTIAGNLKKGLYLGGNRLELPHPDAFPLQSSGMLMDLDLSRNARLNALPPLTGLRFLQNLDVSHCRLRILPLDLLARMLTLKNIRAAHNLIEALRSDAVLFGTDPAMPEGTPGRMPIGGLGCLETLVLCHNRLRELPVELWGCRSLRSLNAAANLLTTFPEPPVAENANTSPHLAPGSNARALLRSRSAGTGVAQPVRPLLAVSLKELHLEGNQIRQFPLALSALTSLTTLTLGFNGLTGLGVDTATDTLAFAPLAELQVLQLSGNRLAINAPLVGKLLAAMPKLQELYLDYNIATEPYVDMASLLRRISVLEVPAVPTPAVPRPVVVDLPRHAARIVIGQASMRGTRDSMEDTQHAEVHFLGKESAIYLGVFDGHAGVDIAAFAAARLHGAVAEEVAKERANRTLRKAEALFVGLRRGFLRTNELIAASAGGVDGRQMGTTALVAVLDAEDDVIYVANAGDCRAVLYDGHSTALRRLTEDHRPVAMETEARRVIEDGGYIADERVGGSLAVSRALGDLELAPWVSPEPTVAMVTAGPSRCRYVVMATDGLWDALSDEDVQELLQEQEREEAANIVDHVDMVRRAAVRLRDAALARGSQDNISVFVVRWEKTAPQS